MNKNYLIDDKGFFGKYGGAYVPEILYKCVHDLQDAYLPIIESEDFQREYHSLLKDYVGRPSPLYYARRMSERYGCRLFLKREDLNHTGAHKINNTIGQILLAKKILLEISKEIPDILQNHPVDVFVDSLGDSAVNMGMNCYVPSPSFLSAKWAVTEAVKLRFDEAGISIPFPQVHVHME